MIGVLRNRGFPSWLSHQDPPTPSFPWAMARHLPRFHTLHPLPTLHPA